MNKSKQVQKIGKIQGMMNQVDGAFLFIWHTSPIACHSLAASMVNQFLSGSFMLSERIKSYFSFYDFLWFLCLLVFFIFFFLLKINYHVQIVLSILSSPEKNINEWHVGTVFAFMGSLVCGELFWNSEQNNLSD